MRHPVSKIAAAVFALAFLPAIAADYYVVVPLKGLKDLNDKVTVALGGVSLPSAMAGQPYAGFDLNSALSVVGDPAFNPSKVSWSVVGGALPAGLVLSNGQISGTPTAGGTSTFQVRASYRTKSGEQGYQVVVGSIQVALGSAALPAAEIGRTYNYDLAQLLSVTGESGVNASSVTWSVVSGALPDGLSLSASGAVTGTPTTSGTSAFQIRASYKSVTGAQAYQVVVGAINVGLASAALPQAQVGQAYSYDMQQLLNVTGDASYSGSGASWSVESGALPAGIALSASGALSGTPTAVGTSAFTVRATYKTISGVQSYQVLVVSIAASLSNIDFGGNPPGWYVERAATLSNTGTAALSLTTPAAGSVTGTGFSFLSTTCGASLAPGATCTTTVRYLPVGIDAASGSLTIATAAGQKTASLAGQSQRAYLGVSPLSRAFGSVTVGQSATGAVHTVTNSGNVPVTGLSLVPAAGFSVGSTDCGASLPANSACNFSIVFAPSAAQTYDENFRVTSSNAGAHLISLSGTGVMPRFSAGQFTCSVVGVRNPMGGMMYYVTFNNYTGYNLQKTSGESWANGAGLTLVNVYSLSITNGQTVNCSSNVTSISG